VSVDEKSPSHEIAIPCENPQEKFVHPLRTLVAAEIDSLVHLTRILAQYCAHSVADCPQQFGS
jgi:hypothetical protein